MLPNIIKARQFRWVGDIENSGLNESCRDRGWLFKDHFRNADTSLGDPARVEVTCVGTALSPCGALSIDEVPFFERRTGVYIVRRLHCSSCEMRPTDFCSRRKSARRSHFPAGANEGLPFITYGTAEWRLKTYCFI